METQCPLSVSDAAVGPGCVQCRGLQSSDHLGLTYTYGVLHPTAEHAERSAQQTTFWAIHITHLTQSSGSASFFLHRFPLQLSELSLMYSSRFSREAELTGCRQLERDFQELAPVSVAPPKSAQWVSELEPQAGLLLLQET